MMAFCFVAIVAWGASDISLSFFTPVLNKAVTKEKIVAISFDDGPDPEHTPEILAILQQHQVPAAFFCIGHRVAAHPHLLKSAYEQGHVIGNHSYLHHFWFDLFPSARMLADLKQADSAIAGAIGQLPKLFRPPYGVTNPSLARAIKRGGYTAVGWSVRSLDTVIKKEDELLRRVLFNVKPGDIFLFHDTCRVTVNILPELIKGLRNKGFTIVRIDQLLNVPAYA